MDEIPGMPKPDNFFDDGDDNIVGRMDEGERPEDFGLEEVCISAVAHLPPHPRWLS